MNPGDRLLYAISAKREMGWPVFKKTFEVLCAHSLTEENLDDMKRARYETARALDALGHIEIDFGSNARLYVAPPTLALLPRSGLPAAVLSGARSPNTINLLSGHLERYGAKLRLEIQNQRDESKRFPARVTVMGESGEVLACLAREADLAFEKIPPAWIILNFSGSLTQYLSGCEWLRTDKLNWEEQQFDVERLRFSAALYAGELQLIRYTHPSRQYPIYYLWRGVEAARVDPDWGRFAVLKEARRDVIHYDRSTNAVLVPATVPLPKLLARALCLCSGLVPLAVSGRLVVGSPVTDQSFRVYPDVPPEFAQIVAGKLEQTLVTDFTLLGFKHD
jgi:hypothetical protein